jgi:flavin reductase (DIM6/NTAB) family NADH-FMN oxidoreductase RutF
MSFTSRELRDALGRFATGITVVTCEGVRAAAGRGVGLTVNSFSSVSLDPPLILWCLDRKCDRFDHFAEADAFAVNVLPNEGFSLSQRFAAKDDFHLDDMAPETWESGAPVLPGMLANFDCVREAVHEAGDHIIIVGRVLAMAKRDAGEPILYFASRYRSLAPLGPED